MRYRVASLATIRGREAALLEAASSITPFVESLHVYINDYFPSAELVRRLTSLPGAVVCLHFAPEGDLTDCGKFYGLCEYGVNLFSPDRADFFTCDDDLIYDAAYFDGLSSAIRRYGRRAAVGYHGRILPPHPVESYYRSRHITVLHNGSDQEKDAYVNVLGTGLLAYPGELFRERPLSLSELRLDYAADLAFAAAMQRRALPMICLAHKARPARLSGHVDHAAASSATIYGRFRDQDERQVAFINSVEWKLFALKTAPGTA